MANPFINQGVDMQSPEAVQIMRRQKMAEQLLQQSQDPLQGQMISGHYVGPSWTQQLAKGLQGYLGRKELQATDEAQAKLNAGAKERNQADMAKFVELLQGKPAQTVEAMPVQDESGYRQEGFNRQITEQPAVAPDMAGAYKFAAGSMNPALQQFGMQGMLTQAQQQAQTAQQEQQRQRMIGIWQQAGGDPQKALAMGMPPDMVKSFAEAPNLGKQEGVVINGQLVNKLTGEPIGKAVPKQSDLSSDLLVPDPVTGKMVPNEALIAAKSRIAASGASKGNTVINQGQKGLDNTLKLRGDFRSEPVYKAHQEMQSAHAQIGASLKSGSPAGDLAAATKIMKLLDPGSVVRESELGMAMAATGLLDRVGSYATNVINGTKLTPQQRKDFQNLADQLYTESVNQYNNKQTEYRQIAERNGLNVSDVVGKPSLLPNSPKPKSSGASGEWGGSSGWGIQEVK